MKKQVQLFYPYYPHLFSEYPSLRAKCDDDDGDDVN